MGNISEWAISRFLSNIIHHLQTFTQRHGTAPLLLLIFAAIALLYSLRPIRVKRTSNQRPSTTSSLPQQQTINSRPRTSTSSRTNSSTNTQPKKSPQILTLDGVHKVTIGFNIHDSSFVQISSSNDNTAPFYSIHEDSITSLLKFVGASLDVYIIVCVNSDAEEEGIKNAFKESGIVGSSKGMIRECKLICCETEMGRVAIVRQLEPQLCIDSSVEVLTALQRFITYTIQFKYKNSDSNAATNVTPVAAASSAITFRTIDALSELISKA